MKVTRTMKQRLSARVYALMAGLLVLCTAFAGNAATIENVRVYPSPENTRVVFDLSAAARFSYFTLYDGGPLRVVLDLHDVENSIDLSQIETESLLLRLIRPSAPPADNVTRVVFEVTDKTEANVFSLAPKERYGHRVVVDLPGRSLIPEVQPARVIRTAETTEFRPVVVAIDAGHGGQDPGSIGPAGTFEKLVTLAVAQRLAAKINADPTMQAVLTRTGDYSLSLGQRARAIRQARADFFISIHADAFTSPQPRGASVWVLSRRRSDTELGRALENKERLSEELYELEPSLDRNNNDPNLARALLDMRRDDSMNDGSLAAELILSELGKVTNLHRRQPQGASFAVLSNIGTPSVLVEVGFISNPQKERLLRNANHQEKLATALYRGVRQHFVRHPIPGTLLANQSFQRHIVRSGESLSVLAARYSTTVDAIMEVNELTSTVLRVGQELQIPTT